MVFLSQYASSLKVALLPFIAGSHPLSMDIISRHLIERGHTPITIISNEPGVLKKLKFSTFALHDIEKPLTQAELQKIFTYSNGFNTLNHVADMQIRYCDALLSNKTLLQSLQDVDVIVADSLYFCSLLLPEVLNKPCVHISVSGDIIGFQTFFGTYVPASYVPLVGPMSTDKMPFLQRVLNVIYSIAMEAILKNWSDNMINTLRFKHNIATNLTLFELRRRFSVHLATLDFSIEIPRPIPPNIHIIGPLSPIPASALPASLETFMQSSGNHGVVILSLGSELQIKDEKLPEMLAALSQVHAKVIWKTNQKINSIPPNIKIVQWMPQNDLLGHNKTIAFITHCGTNGLYEAAYHGVPVIAMPAMAEQIANSRRVVRAGIGVTVDYYRFTTPDIVNAINQIASDKRYKKNVMRISKILNSSPRSSRDIVVDWTEYVVNTDGAHHLKVEGEMLWFHQRYNLDVLVFVIVILYACYRCIKALTKFICNSKAKMD